MVGSVPWGTFGICFYGLKLLCVFIIQVNIFFRHKIVNLYRFFQLKD